MAILLAADSDSLITGHCLYRDPFTQRNYLGHAARHRCCYVNMAVFVLNIFSNPKIKDKWLHAQYNTIAKF